MSNITFKRGQAEWAIWNWTLAGRPGPDSMPVLMKARINKLLELDRRDASLTSEQSMSRFAFLEHAPAGTGKDLELTTFDTFCLALASDMLAFGFKQSEVVFLFRHIRGTLQGWFEEALAYPALGQRAFLKHYPDKPEDPDRPGTADLAIFMVQERIETTDMVEQGTPLLMEPAFYEGRTKLAGHFATFGMSQRRQAYVVEIANAAAWISSALQKAPRITRGRRA
ncbi:MAG: hypothetical protein U1E62_06860 [Alsobacter sp.]